jgi:hypothetical protein
MSWITPNTEAAFQGFSLAERTSVLALLPLDDTAGLLKRCVEIVRDAIRAGGYALGSDGTIPSGLEQDCYAFFIWRFLISTPKNEKMQTAERKQAAMDAQDKLKQIAQQKWAVEPPVDSGTTPANRWNSENKLIPRTHPVPPPASQFPPSSIPNRPYSNPDAPEDE